MKKILILLIFVLICNIAISEETSSNQSSSEQETDADKMSLQKCLQFIMGTDPVIKEAELSVKGAEFMKEEALGAVLPKLNVFAYGGPTPKITGDVNSSEIDWGKWGVFGRIEAELQIPLYTFGRYKNGKKAAENNILLTKAQLAETKFNEVKQFKFLYYGRLYARTMLIKVLSETKSQLQEALAEAEKQYEEMTGEVTKADLGKLKVGAAELEKYLIDARKYLEIAELGLREYLMLEEGEELNLKDDFIYQEKAEIKDFDHYLKIAYKHSPLMRQVNAGVDALYALWKMEKANYAPVLFIGGQFSISGANQIDDQQSVFANDMYNEVTGGLAAGLMWNFDPFYTHAKAGQAEMEYKKMVQTKRFAESGIKILLKDALLTVHEKQSKIDEATKAVKAAKKWVSFSFMGYMIGTQDADAALEGLVAYAMAQNDYYQSIFDYNMALANLSAVIGQEVATELDY